jgi:hypothetical protein
MKFSDLKEYGMTPGQPTPVSAQRSGASAKVRTNTAPSASPTVKSVSQSPTVNNAPKPNNNDSDELVQATAGELSVDSVMTDTTGKELGVVVSKVGKENRPDAVVIKNKMGKYQTMAPNDRVFTRKTVRESAFDQFANLSLMEQLQYVDSLDYEKLDEDWRDVGNFMGRHLVLRKKYSAALQTLRSLMARKTQDRHELIYYAGVIARSYPGVNARELADLFQTATRANENLEEDLRQWFKDKWVRFGPDGKIRGDCARDDDSEGKPKCLPRSKAHGLGKKGRATAARRKRRLDPNAERKGAAKNVATKKETVAEYTDIPFNMRPSCGGSIVHESQLTEKKKQDACYHKVKRRYKVWPSAYASGALVQCRKKGAKNWGNSKNESVNPKNSILGDEIETFAKLIKSTKPISVAGVPNLMYLGTTATPQLIFDVLTQKMGYKKRSGYDTNPNTWDTFYNVDSMITKSDSVINTNKGMQVYYEVEHGSAIKVYFFQYKDVTNEASNCTYGKYYCNTDKKWKCRKGPKKSRSIKESALPDNSKIKILNQLLSVPLMGNDVKSQMQAFFAIPSPKMIKDFRNAISQTSADSIDLRPILRQHVKSMHPSLVKKIKLGEATVMEYSSLDSAKKEIISAVSSIDPHPKDDKLAQQNAQLIDKLYNVLNKSNVLDRIGAVLPDVLKGEYTSKDVTKIAQMLADAPLSFNDKTRFAENLKNNNVINAAVFITPGVYTVDQLTYNDPINKKMLDYMKMYGVGQQMKGPLEHALAIFSKDISIAGKGDITVGGEPVELKAAIGPKASSGGGRFGETGKLPTREKMLSIINSFEEIAPAVKQFLMAQKSMNITTFVQLVNQSNVTLQIRTDIAKKVFGEIFGTEAKPVIDEFSKPNADPDAVRKAYMISNFNWYKNSEMGGKWKYLAAVSLAANAVAVISSDEDLLNVVTYSSNPSIITTDKPQEMLFQFNPKAML